MVYEFARWCERLPWIRVQGLKTDDNGRIIAGTAAIVDTEYKQGGKYHSKQITREKLGRPLVLAKDKRSGIFRTREGIIVAYDADKDRKEFLETDDPRLEGLAGPSIRGKRLTVADFGDMYVLDRFIRESGLYDCIEASGSPNADTFKALVAFYTLTADPNSWAADWYGGSFASVLFPDADMDECRINEFLERIGDPEVQRAFFERYVPLMTKDDAEAVIIDCTGVPNPAHMELTGISGRNGDISLEARLILALRKSDRMPLCLRYVTGNAAGPDVLARAAEELGRMGIDPGYAILDAGYCAIEDMEELLESHIGFIARLKPNCKMYKDMVGEFADRLGTETRVLYKDRFVRVCSAERKMMDSGKKVWLHLMVDEDKKNFEEKTAFKKFQSEEIDREQLDRANAAAGRSILVSSFRLGREEVVPAYFERGGIGQLIDTEKTSGRAGTDAVHSEEAISGKMLLEFISAALKQMMQARLDACEEELSSGKWKSKGPISGRGLSLQHALYILRMQKCDIFANRILPREAHKAVDDVYKLFGYDRPKPIERRSLRP